MSAPKRPATPTPTPTPTPGPCDCCGTAHEPSACALARRLVEAERILRRARRYVDMRAGEGHFYAVHCLTVIDEFLGRPRDRAALARAEKREQGGGA